LLNETLVSDCQIVGSFLTFTFHKVV